MDQNWVPTCSSLKASRVEHQPYFFGPGLNEMLGTPSRNSSRCQPACHIGCILSFPQNKPLHTHSSQGCIVHHWTRNIHHFSLVKSIWNQCPTVLKTPTLDGYIPISPWNLWNQYFGCWKPRDILNHIPLNQHVWQHSPMISCLKHLLLMVKLKSLKIPMISQDGAPSR